MRKIAAAIVSLLMLTSLVHADPIQVTDEQAAWAGFYYGITIQCHLPPEKLLTQEAYELYTNSKITSKYEFGLAYSRQLSVAGEQGYADDYCLDAIEGFSEGGQVSKIVGFTIYEKEWVDRIHKNVAAGGSISCTFSEDCDMGEDDS